MVRKLQKFLAKMQSFDTLHRIAFDTDILQVSILNQIMIRY